MNFVYNMGKVIKRLMLFNYYAGKLYTSLIDEHIVRKIQSLLETSKNLKMF